MFWWPVSGASEKCVDLKICRKLYLPVNGSRNSIGMASSDISIPICGIVTAKLSFHNRTYPTITFSVIKNLCTYLIVGQTFLKLHSSVTFMVNGPEEALMIAPLKTQLLSIAPARLGPLRMFEFLLPGCTLIASHSR